MTRKKKILLLCIALLSLCYLVTGLICKPIICNDAITGMVTLHNYLNDGEWNKALNITADGSAFRTTESTWWAPGQYEVPYLISRLLFINIGAAVVLLMFVSVAVGSYVYFKLFRLIGFNELIILSALLILLLQRFINIFFIQYNASDLFLFALAPAYLYAYLKVIRSYPNRLFFNILLLTLLNLAGCFIKNSFLLFEVAVNVFVFYEFYFNKDDGQPKPVSRIKRSYVFLPLILSNIINYYFFLRLGINPSTGNGLSLSFTSILTGLFQPIIEVLFGSLSISGIYGGFYAKIHLSDYQACALMLLFLVLFFYLLFRKRKKISGYFKKDQVFRFVMTGAAMYVLYWLIFTVRLSAVSTEDRLFLPITILVFPYLIQFVLFNRSKLRYAYIAFACVATLYGIITFVYRIKHFTYSQSVIVDDGRLAGFRVYADHLNSGKDLLAISKFISSQTGNPAIVVKTPKLAFQLSVKNRYIIQSAENLPDNTTGHKANYMVLVEEGKDQIASSYKKIFSSGSYSIYR